MDLADAIARTPGRSVLCLVALLVAVPVWFREFRLDQKWKGHSAPVNTRKPAL